MKQLSVCGLVVLATVLSASAALACPNLTGKYICKEMNEQGQPVDVLTEVTQATAGNATVYTVTDSNGTQQFLADGQKREERSKIDESHPEYGDVIQSQIVSCVANSAVKIAVAYQTDSKVVQINGTIDVAVSLDSATNLSTTTHEVRNQNGKKTQDKTSTEVCKRTN